MDDPDRRAPVSFRLTTRHKRLLELAAQAEQRSQTNFVEKLITDYCQHNRITLDEPANGAKSKEQSKP